MPYLQLWVDPNTGATYPQSYVRVDGQPQVDFNTPQVSMHASRYASQTCYSLGFHPVQAQDISVAGAAYASFFATNVNGARASFNAMIYTTSDTYLGSLTVLSGATAVS